MFQYSKISFFRGFNFNFSRPILACFAWQSTPTKGSPFTPHQRWNFTWANDAAKFHLICLLSPIWLTGTWLQVRYTFQNYRNKTNFKAHFYFLSSLQSKYSYYVSSTKKTFCILQHDSLLLRTHWGKIGFLVKSEVFNSRF